MTREEFVQQAVLAGYTNGSYDAKQLLTTANALADALYAAKGNTDELARVKRQRDGVVDEMQALRVELQLARQQRDSLMSVAETLFMLNRNCGVGQSAGDTIARIRDEIAREGTE